MAPGDKRAKRIAQQAARLEDFERKKARQAEHPNSFKRVSQAEPIHIAKTVHEGPPSAQQCMEWSTDRADIKRSWSWGPRSCLSDDWDTVLKPYLDEYAKKTWREIASERTGNANRRQKHISYEVHKICTEAQKRLAELQQDDLEEIFRFRVSGKKRLYGIVISHWFWVLWWDPEHKIYPTELS